ncbi:MULTISPECIES: hypothetical protein [unclassified Neptuniibacter]|uniref:hypothetical protein n=1 Tax=unclassified Neptuniibacter TaxID=2630693 RepID=UPI0025E01DCC|nr:MULTISPECIES: hypothetical protein [unclassified Neptuniibacter]|tara:strand:+ start:2586 stop:3080 length:495 start_codon:yes stop_codon:yes gene_type:complete
MKQTLEYLKDRYTEEQSRFDHFENKCSKFLTFVTVIIAVISALSGINDGAIFQPVTEVAWVILVLYLFGALSIVCSWGHALLALRIGDCSVMPRSRETAEYLSVVDDETASKHIYNCYVDTLEKLATEINHKSRNLELAYQELTISAWCLGLVAAFTICMEITK